MVPLICRFFGTLWILRLVGAQTLYAVSQPEIIPSQTVVESASLTYSAIGVGADGATTYLEKDVESFLALVYPSTTQILLSTPTTVTVTFVQDASGQRFTASEGTVVQFRTCGFGADEQGTCVDKFAFGTATKTQTYSGPVEPFYTFPSAATLSAPFISRAISCALGMMVLLYKKIKIRARKRFRRARKIAIARAKERRLIVLFQIKDSDKPTVSPPFVQSPRISVKFQ
ncbi:hypothetical protein FB451DRAFT_1363991 [Mycena latifolia]|nr:hypothetical protein FB451DRAFT_1363991 [Mycena latifolia]